MDKGMWAMMPLLAVGTDGRTVSIADRSSQPLHVSRPDLAKARGRVKEDKFRMMTLDTPQTSKLAGAVHKGICQAISLFTEAPPRGARDNFGFAAYKKFADLLVNTRNKHSWERYFTPGVRMYHALAGSPHQPGIYHWVNTWGSADGADRGLYADFLEEAAVILKKPALKESAAKFRESHKLWLKFAEASLPNDVPLLGESKKLIQKKHSLFVEQGEAALPEIKKIHARHREILKASEKDFPLSGKQTAELRGNLRDFLIQITDTEQKAVDQLQAAIV
jgi:hypothetical protein